MTPDIWDDLISSKVERLSIFKVLSIKALYIAIFNLCICHEALALTFIANEFRETIFRPFAPEPGVIFGVSLIIGGNQVVESSKSQIKREHSFQKGRERL